MTRGEKATGVRSELRRLIASACIALAGLALCWALENAAATVDLLQALLDRGAFWPVLCAVAALGLRIWLIVVAPCVVLDRALVLGAATALARRRPGDALRPGALPRREAGAPGS